MAENNNSDDLLGYDDYAHTLWARILAALNSDVANQKLDKKEKLLGDDPLVVGIFGEWGAGKSRLLQLIHLKAEALAKERFTAHKRDSGMDLTVPVFFQPWKYEHESHLLVPLLMHILSELEKSLELSQGLEEKIKQEFDKAGDKIVKAMPSVVSSFGKLIKGISSKFAVADPTGTTVGLAVAAALSAFIAKEKKTGQVNAKDISFEDDGKSYYEIHEILKHITRPKKHKYTHPNYKIDQDIRINFVIFIDDLDRCLPEKAVETLELIKTIFNAESFAFVLALDEEVVERGIGHRYKDYTLVGKKPEMPITGFEYLEKIVHLPFRLPALTQAQALNFLASYEQKLIAQRLPNAPKRDIWFQSKKLDLPKLFKDSAAQQYTAGQSTDDFSGFGDDELEKNLDDKQKALRGIAKTESINLNLAALVIGSFNAFVPRKLIRIVELFHQVLDVFDRRGTGLLFCIGGDPKKSIDPRIALANILLQLFQPDLQRTLRRSKTGFDVLLKAFEPQTTSGGNMQLSSNKSDADLLHWAIYSSGGRPPISLRSATLRLADMTDEGQRYSSQRLLLVIVERLLEHRSIQRHAFDPLKLFETLQASTRNGSLSLPDDTRWMSAMLSSTTETMGDSIDTILPVLTINHQAEIVEGVVVTGQGQTTNAHGKVIKPLEIQSAVSVSNIDGVFLALISPEEPEQKRVSEVAGLRVGQILSKENIAYLITALERRFLTDIVEQQDGLETSRLRRQRLLTGLTYLVPHIAKSDGHRFWDLVEGSIDFKLPIDPKLRAKWYDVRASLGQDNRFRGKYALAKYEDSVVYEAPPGYSKIDDAKFYISQYLVTVAQFDVFKQSAEFKDLAKSKPKEIRAETPEWSDQLVNLNRPVVNINWHEATAYANWLQKRLEAGDLGKISVPAGYALRLPTDTQWEAAARGGLVGKDYPWGDQVDDIDQRANVNKKVGHPTTVGSYDPNKFGLFDMAGNVWEWQKNKYSAKSKFLSLRGGSWAIHPDYARSSNRGRSHPDSWYGGIGFRLVLSLADSEI